MVDYGCIKLDLPFGLKTVTQLEISWRVDDHVRLSLSGVAEEGAISWGEEGTQSEVRLYAKENGNEVLLFTGLLQSARFQNGEKLEASLVAAGYTVLLDMAKKSRSFQRRSMEYEGLFREIMGEYNGDFMVRERRKGEIGSPYIQYEETDWEFMKRLASRYGSPLYACAQEQFPQLYLGMGGVEGGGEIRGSYELKKHVEEYLRFRRKGDVMEQSFLTCTVKSSVRYQIGDEVECSGINFRIGEMRAFLEKGSLVYEYCLVQHPGMPVTGRKNDMLCGRMVAGTVLEVGEGKVRLHLSLDGSQKKEDAYWYPVKREDWYCMPENGSLAALVIPAGDEAEAYVEGFCRWDGQETQNPKEKRMATTTGLQMEATPKSFRLKAGKGGTLELADGKGVRITSKKRISLEMEGAFCCHGREVDLESGERILLHTNKTAIVMDAVVQLKG